MKTFGKLIPTLFLVGVVISCISLEDQAKIAFADNAIKNNPRQAYEMVAGGPTQNTYTYTLWGVEHDFDLSGDEIRKILGLSSAPSTGARQNNATKVPITKNMVDEISSRSPVMWLQFFISSTIKMRHRNNGGGVNPRTGEGQNEEVTIGYDFPGNHRGELMRMEEENTVLYVCFDRDNSNLVLPFRWNPDKNNYSLDAKEKDGKKIIEYGGREYDIEYEDCQLLISFEEKLLQTPPVTPPERRVPREK